jgi:ADP-ribose pyrophosphatase
VRLIHSAPEQQGWETASQTVQYADDHLALVTEEVKSPSRSEPKGWATVQRKAAVVVAAITRDGEFLLVRQERIPIRCALWEMPAGQVDHAGPDAEEVRARATALRELREETAHELAPDGELLPLGDFFSSPGFTNEHEFLFLARPVVPCQEKVLDEAEAILDCRAFAPRELQRMIARNEIRDANTLSTWARLVARGLIAISSL